MARRVFLHVGAPKTGSTFVQNVLWGNAPALRAAGILLPGGGWKAHDQAMMDLRQVSWRDPGATWTWDALVREAAAFDGDVVITNEGLGGATAEQAGRAVASLAPAEVHVVVVGRDLGRTLPSMWQESIRSRGLWSFGEFLAAIESGRHDAFWNHTAPRMLRTWGDHVPAERRHFVTVPPAGAPRLLLWERFASVLGIAGGLCEITEDTANLSLGAAEIELLRRVNHRLGEKYPHRTPYRKVVLRHLVNPVLKQAPNTLRYGLGPDRARWVAEVSEQQVRELAGYPCRVAGDLAELEPAPPRDGMTEPDALTDAQLLDTALDTIVGLLGYTDKVSERADRPEVPVLTRIKRRVAREVRQGLTARRS